MADKNPYCGRPAYSHANNAHECVTAPCELSVPPDITITPVDETPVVRPDCVAIVYASNTEELLQAIPYDVANDRYISENDDRIIWDTSLGWLVQTGNATYFPENAESTSPFGTFCSSAGEAVTTVPCEKAVFPTPEPIAITFDECVEVVHYSDSNEVIQEFTYNLAVERYVATNGDRIELNSDGLWQLTTSNRVYINNVTSDQALGAYCNEADNEVASVIPCGKGEEVIPPTLCVDLVYSADPRIPLGQFNTNALGVFLPVTGGTSEGELSFVSGVGWVYVIVITIAPDETENLIFTGGTNPNIATGLFTDIAGNNILFEDCG